MNEVLKDKINNLKNEIDAMRPLDKDTEGRIQQKFRLDWNFHSNNIEGNSLTFGETKTFLLHGITADGKPLKDHLDIKGHNQALEMLEDIVHDGRDLSENFIREMHEIILHEPYDKPAITTEGKKVSRRIQVGSYKTQPNHVITKTGETFYFAKPEETPALMNDLMTWFNGAITERKLHPVELATLLHYKFIRIHPFDDGNGRLSRILMNLTLMKFGFPPVIIKTQKKDEYYRALQQADGGNNTFFVDYIAQLQIDSLELFLRGSKGEHIEEEDDLDKEIALFKANLGISKNSVRLSTEAIEQLISNDITLLFDQILLKTSQFDNLFRKHIWRYRYIVNNEEQAIIDNDFIIIKSDILGRIKSHIPDEIHFFFNWIDFDSIKYDKFSVNTNLIIEFGNHRYKIITESLTLSKDYSDQITQDEIYEITNSMCKLILAKIKVMIK